MKCALPQSTFFLSALLLELQDSLLQSVENLDGVTLYVSQVSASKHLTFISTTALMELTTLPSFFLSTKHRVYADPFKKGKKKSRSYKRFVL